jgi:hypothetical protein
VSLQHILNSSDDCIEPALDFWKREISAYCDYVAQRADLAI